MADVRPTAGRAGAAPALAARLAPEPHHGGLRKVVHYLRGLVETMLEAHDRLYLAWERYCPTIAIPTLGVHTTAFRLSPAQAQALYQEGREAARAFLETWSFEG